MGEGARRDVGSGLVLCALFAAALVAEQREPTPQVDDAYIAYRYAANWLAGHGLVFNPGEYVEGFTSPLWVALVALGMALGVEATLVGHVLGLLSGAAACVCATLYARAVAPRLAPWVAGLAPGLLLLSAPFVRWTTAGLETTLFAAGLTASLALAAGGRVAGLTAALVVTTLARPEGALAAALLFGAGLVSGDARRRMLAGALVYGGLVLAGTLLRLAYYGALLPNTFHAKVGGVPLVWGWLYLRGFLADGSLLLLPPAVYAVWRRPAARPGALVLLAFALWVVGVGGDLLGEWRFLVPLLPALSALAVTGAGLAWARGRVAGGAALLCCLAAAILFLLGPTPLDGEGSKRARVLDHARRGDRLFERAGARRAEILRARGAEDALVATGAIGSFGFHSDAAVLDILGLTDPVIARTPLGPADDGRRFPGHQRSNAAYVMSREPDYLLIRKKGSVGGVGLRAVLELWERPELERDYSWDDALRGYRRIVIPSGGAR